MISVIGIALRLRLGSIPITEIMDLPDMDTFFH